MSDTNNIEERDQVADKEAFNGLPQKEREETQKILDEIEGNKAPEAPKPTDEEKKPEDKKPEEAPKPEDKKPEDPAKPEARRDVKLMPAWLHERAKADWEKQTNDLKSQLEQVSKGAIKTGEDKKPDEKNDLDKEIEDIADEYGIDPKFAKSIVAIAMKRGGSIPQEFMEKMKQVDQINEQEAIRTELNSFNADFDKSIVPLIKAEYGDTVAPEIVERIRDDFKAKAYSPEYAKVPYTTIYKGEDQFRGVIPPIKKGAEPARGGSSAAADLSGEEPVDLTKPLSDDVVSKLSHADFEIYGKNMEKYEQSQKSK